MKKSITIVLLFLIVVELCSACRSQDTLNETIPMVTVQPGNNQGAAKDPNKVTFRDYYFNMSGEEQAEFISSFDSYEDFFEWHTAAKEAYESEREEWDGSSPIDLGPN